MVNRVVFALSVGLLAGCSQAFAPGKIPVQVDAVAQEPIKKGSSFRVVGKHGEVADADLRFAEAAQIVKNALNAKGLYEAPRPDKTDVIVEIEIGMARPRTHNAVVAAEEAKEKERAAAVATDPTLPGSPPPRALDRVDTEDTAHLRSSVHGPLEKVMVLTAREAHPVGDAPPRTLWQVELSVTDDSNDLRHYLPILAAAAVDQMGVDSGGPATVLVNETDKNVGLMKKGL